MKKVIQVGLPLLVVLIVIILVGVLYWNHARLYPSTDNAYVDAHVVQIAAEVSGKVTAIDPGVHNYVPVKKGQPLFDIDAEPFAIEVRKALAHIDGIRQQMQVNDAAIRAAQSVLAQKQAELVNTEAQTKRILSLSGQKLASLSDADAAIARHKVAQAALSSAQSQLDRAIKARGELGDQNAALREAQAALAIAKLNLKRTHIMAPVAGYISNLHLRVGDTVVPSQALFALVEAQDWTIEANFKESQLARLSPGQLATITLDMYPGVKFRGKIKSISPNSGSSFSLFPPENASGNWVKVTQRFPVKISITPDPQHPLRLGASSTVTINTRHNAAH